MRRAELAGLKISDIDSRRMILHVQGGKGRKDRDIMLRPKLLEALREHWRSLPRKPKVWLFPGNRWHTADYPIPTKVAWLACREAAGGLAWAMTSIRTRCATVSLHTCSKPARTCEPSRFC